MNNQEFTPDSQKQHAASQDNEEAYTQSYSQYRTSDMPKSDHPSDYSGTIPTYSYRAQDPAESNQQETKSQPTSNAKQRTQYDSRPQAADAQQQRISETIENIRKTFTGPNNNNNNNFFQNQKWGGQQSVPPYMRPQQQAKSGPNWLAILLIVCIVLFIIPIVLRVLFALFIALFTMGIGLLLFIACAILIYKFYFKKQSWQRNRWWHW
jgi:E3 ubiquitin-protein ligase DOA10